MGHSMQDYGAREKLPADRRKGMATRPELAERVPFAMTPEGQAQFLQAFLETITGAAGRRCRGLRCTKRSPTR